MTHPVKMDWDEFHREFGLVRNPINSTRGWGIGRPGSPGSVEETTCGCMFETFGAELQFVLERERTHPGTVWTLIEDDDFSCVTDGYRVVNRSGYFITERPARPDTAYEIEGHSWSDD